MNEQKYYVKGSWIFNLESMSDKLFCIAHDIKEGTIKAPVIIAGKPMNTFAEVMSFREDIAELCYNAKCRKVTSKEYGLIKKIVEWRVNARYAICLANGMNERDAGQCFSDM